jgi:hypothetical protein
MASRSSWASRSIVTAGLVPAIQFSVRSWSLRPFWMPGTRPGMTKHYVADVEGLPLAATGFFSIQKQNSSDLYHPRRG